MEEEEEKEFIIWYKSPPIMIPFGDAFEFIFAHMCS